MCGILGVVHLEELSTDGVSLKFPEDLQRSMIENALSFTDSDQKKLASILNTTRGTIFDFKTSRFGSSSLWFVFKLSTFLASKGFEEFSILKLEKKIDAIKTEWVGKSILNPKFPIDFNNKYGAKIIAAIMCDGGLTSCKYPFYVNKNEKLVDGVIKSVEEVVGKIEYNRRTYDNIIEAGFPKILGCILTKVGIVPGKKILTNYPIPPFIIDNPNIYRDFLQQAFDDEGYVNVGDKKGGGKRITLTQYNYWKRKPRRLLQIKGILNFLGVRSSGPYFQISHTAKNGNKTYGYFLQISNQSDLSVFAEKIGFTIDYKIGNLQKLLDSYVSRPRLKNGTISNRILEEINKLKEEKSEITIQNISNKLGKNESWIAEVIRNMIKERKLRVIKLKLRIKGCSNGFSRKQFDLYPQVQKI
ncbi:MAG: hypothetical protein COY38_03865 [Candidatus Aenigmarchaeota archaeon CG_4_10_14_0_8_um_filter_37_24]|nr:hypothetical protein [Candidatus Aenigmarchaeota archaeon]OIN86565.1 MAG: hypothetical protein AUJ50_03705 [Candidatus Aenigmarchaeota archaeon CG1_02_38_14]PIW41701.1 MAG: hypothetical protein COW21_00390 [Candidatus Aenigmarchaeota archaeon CG15_BIG_FIL_POST_REV_8_21_14_020_37_27]PIY34898.1 MAG: hypothetical protein COZ04_05195 [Candidatus Aenigmarchaeota archaeon CG_4_10_14_3_um_filter_37_21]PIZ34606.1 MAG: hypothetical protein COY38_03865 [Candidatus Aenigmarchaeota archaeon CG_4_10_14_0